jgi:hypothetical protein
MYTEDVEALNAKVTRLKALGWTAASRSHLIRIALGRLDDDAIVGIAAEQRRRR